MRNIVHVLTDGVTGNSLHLSLLLTMELSIKSLTSTSCESTCLLTDDAYFFSVTRVTPGLHVQGYPSSSS